LCTRKVNMVSVVCQKSQYDWPFSGTQHFPHSLFWHTTLIILTFSGTKHLSYWPFWEKAIWQVFCARKVNMINVVCQKSQYDKCWMPEKSHKKLIILTLSGIQHLPYWLFWHTTLIILTFSDTQHLKGNITSVMCQKRQYDICCMPENSIW
jgi:hypothetical protein